MNKKIAKLWVKALRSGKYRKTTGQLCKVAENGNKSYCCLGVLTDLYNKEHYRKVGLSDGLLSDRVMRWAGMSSEDGMILGKGLHYSGNALTELNDCGCGKRSFKRMADIIERNMENL